MNLSVVVEVEAGNWTYGQCPNSYLLCRSYVNVDGCSEIEWRVLDVREESVMYNGGYLLYGPSDELRKAFVVTQFVEEVVAVDNDNLSS